MNLNIFTLATVCLLSTCNLDHSFPIWVRCSHRLQLLSFFEDDPGGFAGTSFGHCHPPICLVIYMCPVYWQSTHVTWRGHPWGTLGWTCSPELMLRQHATTLLHGAISEAVTPDAWQGGRQCLGTLLLNTFYRGLLYQPKLKGTIEI